jgi:hypothetical protein
MLMSGPFGVKGLKASGFNLKVESSLKDYLSCRVIENLESKSILILQLHLINNLKAKFGREVCNKRVYKTPGSPRFKIVRPDDGIIKIEYINSVENQSDTQEIYERHVKTFLEEYIKGEFNG